MLSGEFKNNYKGQILKNKMDIIQYGNLREMFNSPKREGISASRYHYREKMYILKIMSSKKEIVCRNNSQIEMINRASIIDNQTGRRKPIGFLAKCECWTDYQIICKEYEKQKARKSHDKLYDFINC